MSRPTFSLSDKQVSVGSLERMSKAVWNLIAGLRALGKCDDDGVFAAYVHGAGADAGSSITHYKITAIHDDYLTCHLLTGATEGTDPILVAKPSSLRTTVTSIAAPSGVTATCTYNSGATTRTATATSGPAIVETQVLNVAYNVNDEIIAVDIVNTGVIVSAVELTLLDLNNDARHWVTVQT